MSVTWYNKKWGIILLHTAAWLLLFALPFLLRPSMNNQQPPEQQAESGIAILRYILNDIIYICFFYLNALWLVPKFFYNRKYSRYALVIVMLFVFLLLVTWFIFFELFKQSQFNLSTHILFNFFFFLFFLAGSTAYAMIKDRTRADRMARDKQTENLKTELSLLRSQASPHFMFNVLNNMVALARKKSDLLEPSLLKFSSLLRYMLYEADEEKVPVEKEIEYLQSYIDLQKQRFGNNVQVNVSLEENTNHHEIEPMLMIPFVENAFKHGTGMIQQPQINIHLKTDEAQLNLVVENKYDPSSQEIKDKTSGIGLTNVKRRLNLLYDQKHKLEVKQKDNWFSVLLQLNLK